MLWRSRRFLLALGIGGVVTTAAAVASVDPVAVPGTGETGESLWVTGYLCTAEVGEAGQRCDYDTAVSELSPSGEDRVFVAYDQMPPHLIEAILATEDQHFFDHPGVDPTGVLRASWEQAKDLLPGLDGSTQGGSTITQQYVKLVSGDDEAAVERKLREMVRAVRLERDLTAEAAGSVVDPRQEAKERLLEAYLNRVWFGRRAYGVEAAARNYFAKSVHELTVAESAYLAGLIRNPTRADYAAHPAEAERRRTITLDLMVAAGYLTPAERDAAQAEPWTSLVTGDRSLGLVSAVDAELGTAHFVAAVHGQLDRIFPGDDHERQGVRVSTTLDRQLQRAANEARRDVLAPVDPAGGAGRPGREVALVSLDADGRVVALIGGSDWARSQVNLALGPGAGGRGHPSAGLLGPVLLASYLEQGNDPARLFSSPPRIGLVRGDARVDVFGGGVTAGGDPGRGSDGPGDGVGVRERTAHGAVVHSSSTALVQLLDHVDPAVVIDTARRLGLDSPLRPGSTLALGFDEVSVIEVASAYATLDRGGLALDPVLIERVESVDGRTLCWYPSRPDDCSVPTGQARPERPGIQVLPTEVTEAVNRALAGVVEEGTAQAASLVDGEGRPIPVAGKTAVSSGYRDLWFVGSACGVTTAVWVEGPGPRAGARAIGPHGEEPGSGPAGEVIEVWRAYMAAAVAGDRLACEPDG